MSKKSNDKGLFPIGMKNVYEVAQEREMIIFHQKIIIGLLVLMSLMAMAISSLIPLKTYVPVFTQLMTNQELVYRTMKPAELSIDQQKQMIREVLKDFVIMREKIDSVAAINLRSVKVKALSSKAVFSDYAKDIRDVMSSERPFTRDVYIRSDQALHYAPPSPGNKGTQLVRFHSTSRLGDGNVRKETYVATIKYRYLETKMTKERAENNVFNIQVYSYQVDKDELNRPEPASLIDEETNNLELILGEENNDQE